MVFSIKWKWLLLFSHRVMPNSLRPNELQLASLPCPSLSPEVCSNLCPLSWWFHPTILSCVTPFSSCPQSFPASGSFPVNRLFTYWSFSFSPSSEYIFMVDFLKDWLVWVSCSLRDSQESSQAPQFESINTLVFSLLYGPTLTSVHDYWKNHSFDYMDLCQESDVSAF